MISLNVKKAYAVAEKLTSSDLLKLMHALLINQKSISNHHYQNSLKKLKELCIDYCAYSFKTCGEVVFKAKSNLNTHLSLLKPHASIKGSLLTSKFKIKSAKSELNLRFVSLNVAHEKMNLGCFLYQMGSRSDDPDGHYLKTYLPYQIIFLFHILNSSSKFYLVNSIQKVKANLQVFVCLLLKLNSFRVAPNFKVSFIFNKAYLSFGVTFKPLLNNNFRLNKCLN